MIANNDIMAKNITRLMAEKGVKAVDVCEALGFKKNTFSDWVNGKKYPRIDKIEMMAKYFGVSKADLVEDEYRPKELTLTYEEREIITAYRNLSNDQKDMIASAMGVKRQDMVSRSSEAG